MGAGETLRLARDVPGVAGSFLLDNDGRVLARDMPEDVTDEVLASVGRRCRAVLEATRMPMPGSDQVVLRFDELAVFSVRAGDNVFVLLAENSAQTSVVRIATRATAARLSLVSEPDPWPVPPPPPDAAVPASAPLRRPAASPPAERSDGVWG